MKEILCITPSWDDMAKYAKKTAEKIILNNYRPDYIIAIARGGVVPARLLCDHLYIKSFLSIKVDHWGVTATADGKAKLSQGLDLSLEGKKVLLVDDITDTGQSIELARDHILKLKPKFKEVKLIIFELNSTNRNDNSFISALRKKYYKKLQEKFPNIILLSIEKDLNINTLKAE